MSPSRPRREPNRSPIIQGSAPVTVSSTQQIDSHQDRNLGSRFRVLTTLNLNTTMEVQDTDIVEEMDTVPAKDAVSNLATSLPMETGSVEANHDDAGNSQGRDILSRGRVMQPIEEAQYHGTRERRRPAGMGESNVSAHSSARSPRPSHYRQKAA